MDDVFTLPVTYKGQEREYEGQLFRFGYTYRIRMWIEGLEVDFERDEEGAFRAALPFDTDLKVVDKVDRDLLQAVAEKIAEVLA